MSLKGADIEYLDLTFHPTTVMYTHWHSQLKDNLRWIWCGRSRLCEFRWTDCLRKIIIAEVCRTLSAQRILTLACCRPGQSIPGHCLGPQGHKVQLHFLGGNEKITS